MILLSTGSLYLYGVRRVFELAAEAGFDGIEMLIDNRVDTWQIENLARLSSDTGLPIAALHAPFMLNMAFWPAAEGERIERTVGIAERLSADVVVAHLPTRWLYSVLITPHRRFPVPHFWRPNRAAAAWYEQTLPFLQAETRVKIAIEIMPMHRIFRWPINAHLWNTLAEWSEFEHLTLDTTHCATWGVDPQVAYDRAAGRVAHVHLSNFDGRQHLLPHQGKLNLAKFLRHLRGQGYQGHVAVETGPEAMEAFDLRRVRTNLAASLAFCRDHLG
jgi:sugar phosphate isomerase/epimerase